MKFRKFLPSLLLLASVLSTACVKAQADPALVGHWRVNEKLSDDTDDAVEKALKASGGKLLEHKWFDSRKDKYRGGPAEQELYDRLSYDPVLTITERADSYVFEYADHYQSVVYTDNRSHAVSLNALEASEDFLMGHWEAGKFQVEMHPRDGGYVNATYMLIDAGKKETGQKDVGNKVANKRLQALFVIKPGTFTEEIKLERVYDFNP